MHEFYSTLFMCYDRHNYMCSYKYCITNNWIKIRKSLVSVTKVKSTRSRYVINNTDKYGPVTKE